MLASTAGIATLAAVVSGCSAWGPAGPGPDTTPTDANAAPSAEPTPVPETTRPAPTLDPDGSALQNRDYFDYANERLVEEQDAPDGRAFIDNLIAAGFAREAMEVTPDRTAADLAADSIQFAVRIGDACLLGQYGDIGYVSHVTDALSTGKCLVGRTRPIDW
ncbi:DUF6993 domain-containing protein [Lysobacter korlensis]|uniref:DUF6993 domain-containing protein n=1 Tax=Lysobacter korlensis TaxID=553636 RepID=A0ABV6RR44_9GAMM